MTRENMLVSPAQLFDAGPTENGEGAVIVIRGAQFLLRSQGIRFVGDSSENRATNLQISYWPSCLNFFDARSAFV